MKLKIYNPRDCSLGKRTVVPDEKKKLVFKIKQVFLNRFSYTLKTLISQIHSNLYFNQGNLLLQ
jgi:hypothetical protein